MVAALIWYKQRAAAAKGRAAEAKGTEQRATADPQGSGVVVFDVETTSLIDDGVSVEDMEVSVATAVWLPQASTAPEARHGATAATFWHARVRRAPSGGAARSMAELLAWLDAAN